MANSLGVRLPNDGYGLLRSQSSFNVVIRVRNARSLVSVALGERSLPVRQRALHSVALFWEAKPHDSANRVVCVDLRGHPKWDHHWFAAQLEKRLNWMPATNHSGCEIPIDNVVIWVFFEFYEMTTMS